MPTGVTGVALHNLVKWATGSKRSGNPHTALAVRLANKALGGDGYDLPQKNAGKQPTKAQLAKVAAIFRALRKVAARYDQRVMKASLKVDSSIHVSSRAFAMTRVANGKVDVRIAPELALEPKNVQVGVLRHELSHALAGLMGAKAPVKPPKSKAYDAIERHADKIAEKVFKTKIFYDSRGVEVSGPGAKGTRPRPAGLR
jgi:hypothetical protein